MTKPNKRRSSSVEHRSTKRRKPSGATIYSTRVITWKEQLTLPPRFHEERDVWPALKILEERGTGRKREYLLEWEPHPRTGEIFEPTWEPADNVGQELKQEWQGHTPSRKSEQSLSIDSSRSSTRSNVPHSVVKSRRARDRRIIPDPSAESAGLAAENSSPSRTPTLTASPGSEESLSLPIEILESQQPRLPASVHVTVPPVPSDKSDWESLRESQFTAYESHDNTPLNNNSPRSPIRSSLRLRTSTNTNRLEGFQKILDYQSTSSSSAAAGIADIAYTSSPLVYTRRQAALTGRCARRTNSSNPSSQESPLSYPRSEQHNSNIQIASSAGMAARGTRQSPRLQNAVPQSNAGPPRIAVRTGSFRTRSNHNPPEHSSPLAASAELAEPDQDFIRQSIPESSFMNNISVEHNSASMSTFPPASIAPSAMHIDPTGASALGSLSQDSSAYDTGLNTLTMPVQESIEDEITSSTEGTSLASKASSSQESLRNERLVPQIDGLVMPTYPILGEDEFVIALPAEGKVQAIYTQTIKVKRKAVLKFIRRRGSVNTASTSTNKTIERNEMIELIGRLHDTTTHIDLGLPGIPTQYTIPSHEHAAYAEYAGSKFVFLGYLLDYFKRRSETIVIMAKSGATQDLLEEYLYMKNVQVRRHEGAHKDETPEERMLPSPRVELLSTRANEVVELDQKPCLVIAFDASFEALHPQVRSLRVKSPEPIPILHLLVTNSSEHVERCLPASMPSPIRLRLLVRATYQAHFNLGGSPTIITNPSDEVEGRPMDLGDISRAVRKSPNRRLEMVAAVVANAMLSDDFAANWTLNSMPELALEELEESPSTGSTISATPIRSRNRSQTPVSKATSQTRNRSQTPMSRATTPSARKRQLEVDTTGLNNKRQRTTPVNEHPEPFEHDTFAAREQELHRLLDSLRAELLNEKRAREAAEAAKAAAEKRATEWQTSLASLQRRYEKRTQKSHEQQKVNTSLSTAVENSKIRADRLHTENSNLRQQIMQQKKELEAARQDLKAAGGDVAVLEIAREEARNATAKAVVLEKSLESTKRDFEFLRSQYQDASNRGAELGTQVRELESQTTYLSAQASTEKRHLRELNHAQETQQHLARITQLETEKRNVQVMYKKLEEESKLLKRNRGVQTRGSSTAPGSPGQRSRQGSPAAPPSGSRASVLRRETGL